MVCPPLSPRSGHSSRTEFGLVAFLIADAVTNFVNLRLADETGSNRLFPALGLIGTTVAIPTVFYHLYRTDIEILLGIVGIFLTLFLIDLLSLERSPFEPEIDDEA